MKPPRRWETVLIAGLGAAAAQIDPSLPPYPLALSMVKAFIGAAVGAYLGNHIANRRGK